ncbi:hypothetical protein, partial [Gilliamella sp. W8123]|uniref:hypothetical protein n=1 Tax=Gilliamella sp. W8123 TaxID=2750992 RepID=UPI001E521936
FAMLTSLSCQHVANVAKLNTPNLFAKINVYVYSKLILVLKPISVNCGWDFGFKNPVPQFFYSSFFTVNHFKTPLNLTLTT